MRSIEQPLASPWPFISYLASAGMVLVISVASCTSTETFREIYDFVAELLSLSTSSFSLRNSTGLGFTWLGVNSPNECSLTGRGMGK